VILRIFPQKRGGRNPDAENFFDQPATRAAAPSAPYALASETSKGAAEGIAPCTGRMQSQVFDFIRTQDEMGATDEELTEALGMLSDTARARRVELRDRSLIIDSGKRRPTRRGRAAVVWVITGNGVSRP
jgi:hypothetical protein